MAIFQFAMLVTARGYNPVPLNLDVLLEHQDHLGFPLSHSLCSVSVWQPVGFLPWKVGSPSSYELNTWQKYVNMGYLALVLT